MTDSQPTPAPEPAPTPELKFSQEALDKIVGQRLAEERQKFANYDDLKAQSEELQKLKDGQKSDLERTQEGLTAAEKARQEAEGEREKIANELRNERVRVAVLEAASGKKIVSPTAAVKLLDHSEVEFDDDGKPTNIDTLLDGLVAEHEFLLAPAGPGFDGGPRPTSEADVTPGLGRLAHAYEQGSH